MRTPGASHPESRRNRLEEEIKAVFDLSTQHGGERFRYLEIVEALRRSIRDGGLTPGTRLPPQRAVAAQLGVSIATVNRAYVEAARRGLIVGHVGRGTFVAEEPSAVGPSGREAAADIDLTTNRLSFGEGAVPHLLSAIRAIGEYAELDELMRPRPGPGHHRHRVAGCKWLAKVGVEAKPDEVVICNGLQHGLSLILTAFAEPDDAILTEELNYPGIKLLDKAHNVNVQGLAIDAEGLCPDAIEAACARGRARFLICTPSIHNPTNAMMPVGRRKALAKLAERHDLLIIECDNNEIPPVDPLPQLCDFAKERSFHVSSAWRVSGAGIHLGFIRASIEHAQRIALALQATTWMISPLQAEIFSIWINDGTAERILGWHRNENARRLAIAMKVLGDRDIGSHPDSPNIWIHLPAPWRSEDFAQLAARRGVLVTTADNFAVGRTVAPHAVRVSLGGARDHESLERGLRHLADILAEGPRPAKLVL